MRMRNKLIYGAVLAGSMAILSAGTARATILPFTENTGNSQPVPIGYADNVAGSPQATFTYTAGAEGWTPNVTADFGSSTKTYPNYNNLPHIVFASDSNGSDLDHIRVTLTAATGYKVQLYSIDVASYNSGINRTADSIKVIDEGSNVLANLTGTATTAPGSNTSGAATITFNPSIVKGQSLELVIDLTTDSSTNYGMSNLRFGQSQVPEPASLSLMGLASLLVMRRRRQA